MTKEELTEINTQLLRAADDDDAIGWLIKKLTPMLFAVAIKELRHRGEAEDAVAEVFADLPRLSRKYRAGGNGYNFLCVAVKNRARDIIRSRKARTLREENYTAAELTERLKEREADEDKMDVARALSKLPADEFEIVRLTYWYGCSTREVAKRTGLSATTVRRKLKSAGDLLRQLLSDD